MTVSATNDDVLGRLNALLNRDKQAAVDVPPPPAALAEVPLLTDIYVPPAPAATVSDPTDELVQAAVPMMVKVVEEVLASYAKPAMDEAISRAVAEMQPRIDALLRQQLKEMLAQRDV
jgi:hypothetical protein